MIVRAHLKATTQESQAGREKAKTSAFLLDIEYDNDKMWTCVGPDKSLREGAIPFTSILRPRGERIAVAKAMADEMQLG